MTSSRSEMFIYDNTQPISKLKIKTIKLEAGSITNQYCILVVVCRPFCSEAIVFESASCKWIVSYETNKFDEICITFNTLSMAVKSVGKPND